MRLQFSRGRVCALIVLLSVYLLAGVALLSTVSVKQQQQQDRTHGRHSITSLFSSKTRGAELSPGMRISSRRLKMQWCRPLHYLLDPSRQNAALVSFPGSGNTWLRYLLQQATGINTGSVYKDLGLLKNGFPGESVSNSSVLVVKTHELGPLAHRGYDKAILLVRDPQQAILAEFNRQGGGHIGFASPDRYKIGNGKYWEKFVNDKTLKWKTLNLDWLFNFTKPKCVIFYDQLVSDIETNLRTALNFLDVQISEPDFQCALERREGIYRRRKRIISLDPFTEAMKGKIDKIKEEVYSLITEHMKAENGRREARS